MSLQIYPFSIPTPTHQLHLFLPSFMVFVFFASFYISPQTAQLFSCHPLFFSAQRFSSCFSFNVQFFSYLLSHKYSPFILLPNDSTYCNLWPLTLSTQHMLIEHCSRCFLLQNFLYLPLYISYLPADFSTLKV